MPSRSMSGSTAVLAQNIVTVLGNAQRMNGHEWCLQEGAKVLRQAKSFMNDRTGKAECRCAFRDVFRAMRELNPHVVRRPKLLKAEVQRMIFTIDALVAARGLSPDDIRQLEDFFQALAEQCQPVNLTDEIMS